MSRPIPLTIVSLALLGAGIVRMIPPTEDIAPQPAAAAPARDAATPTPRVAAVTAALPTKSAAVPATAAAAPARGRKTRTPAADPTAEFIRSWLEARRATEHELLDRIAGTGGAAQVAAMEQFNAAVDARRGELLAGLTPARADAVAVHYGLFRFDTNAGAWHAIDAHGRRIAFRHEDDDIWRNGESSNPRWQPDW